MSDPDDRFDGQPEPPPVEPSVPPAAEEGRAAPAPRLGAPWGLALFLVLAVLLVVFAVQNTQDVELNFLGWSGEFPLVIIIISVFVISVLLDEMILFVTRRRRHRRARERAELERLRARGD